MTDTHGNVVQLLDETRNIIKTYEYDSFGNEVNTDKKDDNPFYQPSVGRFITRDTYTGESDELLSLHLYTYCYNNPIMYSDMGGNSPVIDWFKSLWNKITAINKSNNKN